MPLPISRLLIPATLAVLLLLTRGHHFPTTLAMLPSASWAVFLLAGRYAPSSRVFALLLGEAALIDYFAITAFGVSDFCVSPAYAALLPAYSALWLAGRWLRRHLQDATSPLSTVLPTLAATLVGTLVCELLASGSFYVFSGRFNDPTLVEFAARLLRYYPPMLLSAAFWLGLTNMLVNGISALRRRATA